MNLAEKLEVAKKAYEEARARLDTRRAAYEIPQKEYAETKANLSRLKERISEGETSLLNSKTKLAVELRDSNGETTAAVKKVLSDRRDTEDLLDEVRIIAQEVEKRMDEIRKTISEVARNYQSAYHDAAHMWAKVEAYRVLVDCAPQLSRAMAVLPAMSVEALVGQDSHGAILVERSLNKNIILKEIPALLEDYTGDLRPYRADLGVVDLGALNESEILTPAQLHALKPLQKAGRG